MLENFISNIGEYPKIRHFGLKADYNPENYKDVVYFATDEAKIYLNGVSYSVDAYTKSEIDNKFSTNGDGTKFLADNGEYKEISSSDNGILTLESQNFSYLTEEELAKLITGKYHVIKSDVNVFYRIVAVDSSNLIIQSMFTNTIEQVGMSIATSPVGGKYALTITEDNCFSITVDGGVSLTSTGDGTKFLSDDGTYKIIESTSNEVEIVVYDESNPSNSDQYKTVGEVKTLLAKGKEPVLYGIKTGGTKVPFLELKGEDYQGYKASLAKIDEFGGSMDPGRGYYTKISHTSYQQPTKNILIYSTYRINDEDLVKIEPTTELSVSEINQELQDAQHISVKAATELIWQQVGDIITNLQSEVSSLKTRVAELESYNKVKILTQAEYDALETKDDNVLYITDDSTTTQSDEASVMSLEDNDINNIKSIENGDNV